MKNITLLLLSILIVSGYLLDVYLVLGGKVETADPNKLLMIGQAVGGLQAMAMMVASYFFGTTKGSEEKNTTVSEAMPAHSGCPDGSASAGAERDALDMACRQ